MKYLTAPLLAGLLVSPAIGQETAPDRAAIQKVAQTLSLSKTDINPGNRRGPDLEGTLPGGVRIEIDFHRDGSLEEIEASHSRPAPVSEVRAVLPEVLLNADRFPVNGVFESIEFKDDGFEIDARDAEGRWFEAEYAPNGALREWDAD